MTILKCTGHAQVQNESILIVYVQSVGWKGYPHNNATINWWQYTYYFPSFVSMNRYTFSFNLNLRLSWVPERIQLPNHSLFYSRIDDWAMRYIQCFFTQNYDIKAISLMMREKINKTEIRFPLYFYSTFTVIRTCESALTELGLLALWRSTTPPTFR